MKEGSWLAWLPKRHEDVPPETWEAQYTSGYWNYLQSLGELGRYSVIVGYCRRVNPRAAVADIGCGEGILQRLLHPCYAKYVGVDASGVAIARAEAAARSIPDTTFLQSDARDFVPDERFDIIVFNECLYYFAQPVALLRRYEQYLRHGGVFIISNVIARRTRVARKQLKSVYSLRDRVLLENAQGIRWQVQLLSLHDPPDSHAPKQRAPGP